MVPRRETSKNRKITDFFRIKQTVVQLLLSLTSPGASYAEAARNTLPKAAIQPVPSLNTNPFRELIKALPLAPINEQCQFAAIKLIFNQWS